MLMRNELIPADPIDDAILDNEMRRASGELMERDDFRAMIQHDLKRQARESAERMERNRQRQIKEISPVVTGQGSYQRGYTPTVCDVRRDWARLAWGLAPWAVAAALLALAGWIGGGK